jgi:hypothetical protein
VQRRGNSIKITAVLVLLLGLIYADSAYGDGGKLLFSVGLEYTKALDNNIIPEPLRQTFAEKTFWLPRSAKVKTKDLSHTWSLIDADGTHLYTLKASQQQLEIHLARTNFTYHIVSFPNFSKVLISSQVPPDVYNSTELDSLKPPTAENLIKLRRLTNIYSWRTFLALSWPVDARWTPRPHLTDAGEPRWLTWKDDHEIFKSDGSQPEPWGSPNETPEFMPCQTTKQTQYLHNLSTTENLTSLHVKLQNTEQAFSHPLWDQNGRPVYYQILLNKIGFDFIKTNELYNQQGQINFYNNNKYLKVITEFFPWGTFRIPEEVGVIAMKLAWKIMGRGDIPSRFYTMQAGISEVDASGTEQCIERTVGLVGIHIAHKTFSSNPQWIWSTFEHIDNVQVNDMEVLEYGNKLTPSFYNPYCATCLVNVPPQPEETTGLRKTQVRRVIPIPDHVTQLNRQVQEALKTYRHLFTLPARSTGTPNASRVLDDLDAKEVPQALQDAFVNRDLPLSKQPLVVVEVQGHKWRLETPERRYAVRLVGGQLEVYEGSVWQYYELIDTQWPTNTQTSPVPPGYGVQSISNKSGGQPTPVYLTNAVMETYFQQGNRRLVYQDRLIERAIGPNSVFGTESCMGCHSEAGMAIDSTGTDANRTTIFKPGTANFSWLLQKKAHWKSPGYFSVDASTSRMNILQEELNRGGKLPEDLQKEFAQHHFQLHNPKVDVILENEVWRVIDNVNVYTIRKEEKGLFNTSLSSLIFQINENSTEKATRNLNEHEFPREWRMTFKGNKFEVHNVSVEVIHKDKVWRVTSSDEAYNEIYTIRRGRENTFFVEVDLLENKDYLKIFIDKFEKKDIEISHPKLERVRKTKDGVWVWRITSGEQQYTVRREDVNYLYTYQDQLNIYPQLK